MRWPAPGTRSAPAFRNNRHMQDFIDRVRFDANGLVPVIAQDRASGTVLMLAWANADALRHTVSTRQGTYLSRSRGELWIKGATSGATQHVREVRLDCDADAVLYVVDQHDGACHTGARSCFDADVVLGDPDA
jgi:phosphoribosyl-AMP cyclohydrolase